MRNETSAVTLVGIEGVHGVCEFGVRTKPRNDTRHMRSSTLKRRETTIVPTEYGVEFIFEECLWRS